MKPSALPLALAVVAAPSVQEAAPPWSPAVPLAGDRYDGLILENAERQGLNPRLLKALIAVESESSPRAVSPRGARGLMQVMPETARELGEDPGALHEPEANLRAGSTCRAGGAGGCPGAGLHAHGRSIASSMKVR